MLEIRHGVPRGVVALRAVGRLTAADYRTTVQPLLEDAHRQGRRLRLLLQLGPEYEGFTAGAVWGKTETWLENPGLLHEIEGYALVSDIAWIREVVGVAGFLVPFPMRTFPNARLDAALAWLASLPEGSRVACRVLPETGVLVVEVAEPLRPADLDAVTATADAWLAEHDELAGVVVHALTFPGWEDLGALVRHLRFVRDHHRRIRRVALAADGPLASLAPRLAEHFVRSEVRTFAHDRVGDALAWAGAAAGDRPLAASGLRSPAGH